MVVTKDEAKKMYCPFRSITGGFAYCKADSCMAWMWTRGNVYPKPSLGCCGRVGGEADCHSVHNNRP